jgi:guanylate kinase
LRSRGTEDKQIIETRVKQAKWEISQAKFYDYQIVNDDINQAKIRLKNILLKELENNGK